MYLLPCPNCQANVKVTPAQAGDDLPCPSCEASVAIPKLGDLRRLPREDESQSSPRRQDSDAGVGARIAFATLGLIAVPSLLAAGYSGIRWIALETPISTEKHLEEIEKVIFESPPATMIREFEDMEKFSLDITSPYGYKRKENEKSKWRNATMVAGILGLVCVVGAIVAASSAGGKKQREQ